MSESLKTEETSIIFYKLRLYTSYEALASDFSEGALHPGDLKPAVAKAINELIDPVRKHFETDPDAKALIAKIKSFKKTEVE